MAIKLGTPEQVLDFGSPDAMGMFNGLDLHTALLRQPDGSYQL